MPRTPIPFFLFWMLSLSTSAEELIFKHKGEPVATVALEDISKKLGVAPQEVRVWEGHMKIERVYRAFPLKPLLNAIYREKWELSEEVLFTCADGYQPSIPTAKFKRSTPYLAFALPGSEFKVDNEPQNEKNLNLGPFYLVWENIHDTIARDEGLRDWPYQITTLDLVSFADRFPGLAPPTKASSAVQRGFLAFRQHCVSCHTINGEGSPKAPELNYPVSVTEYFKSGWLEKWILDPNAIRHNTTMPAFKTFAAKDPKLISDLIRYLKAMAKSKRKPK